MRLSGDSPEELAAAALEVVAEYARRPNATAVQLDALRNSRTSQVAPRRTSTASSLGERRVEGRHEGAFDP